MKLMSAVFFLALCTSVSANEGEMLAKAKEHATSNIEKRIGYLQELKSCISAATERGSMKKCRDDHQTKMKSLKDENESWMEGMKAERKAKKKK